MAEKEYYTWGEDYKLSNDPAFWVLVYGLITLLMGLL